MDNQEPDIIEMTDDEGNTILMEVVDYFFYNGEEYVIVSEYKDEDSDEERDCYVMHVITSEENGEEYEEFEPIEDEALEEKLMSIADNTLNGDDEPEA